MTSPDGEMWTLRASAADSSWAGVTYHAGLFVAVGFSPIGQGVMTSGTLVQQRVLSVSRTGSGSGNVTSSPAGIDCGSTCSASFPNDSMAALTATPAAGSKFTGWAETARAPAPASSA